MGKKYLEKFQEKHGSVEEYLKNEIKEKNTIVLGLLDPTKLIRYGISYNESAEIANALKEADVSAILLGGSTGVKQEHIDGYAYSIKEHVEEKPVIIFPRGPESIGEVPDAIWFMSLLNSTDPYFITGAPAQAALLIKKYGLETLPMGYIVIEPGGTAGKVGKAELIRRDKDGIKLASKHALAAQYSGKRWVFLEAGSGAEEPVPSEMIREVRKTIDIPLGVGGGIRNSEQVRERAASGTDYIFIGTIIEELIKDLKSLRMTIEEMVEAGREGAKKRTL